jgi:hypothetical protein
MSDPKLRPSAVQNAYVRVCPACSRALEPTRSRQVYCCSQCRFDAANRRRHNGASDPRLRKFYAVVSERMAKGAKEYGERSWSADPERLAREILEELADVAGWAAIAFARVGSIAEVARRLREESR